MNQHGRKYHHRKKIFVIFSYTISVFRCVGGKYFCQNRLFFSGSGFQHLRASMVMSKQILNQPWILNSIAKLITSPPHHKKRENSRMAFSQIFFFLCSPRKIQNSFGRNSQKRHFGLNLDQKGPYFGKSRIFPADFGHFSAKNKKVLD